MHVVWREGIYVVVRTGAVVVGRWVEFSYIKIVKGDDFTTGVIVWLVVVSAI